MAKLKKQHSTPHSANVNVRSSTHFMRIGGLITLLALILLGGWLIYQAQKDDPIEITVAAGPLGSDSYQLMKDVAHVVSTHSDFVSVKVQASGDSSFNIGLLDRGQVDMATIQDTTPVVSEIRLVTQLFPDFFHLIVRQDSAARSIKDLEKIKISVPPFGTNAYLFFWAVADHYDFSPSDIEWVSLNEQQSINALLDGSVDGIFYVKSVQDSHILNLVQQAGLKNIGLRYLPIEQAPAMGLKRPLIGNDTILAGALDGRPILPTANITTATVHRVLVAHQSVPSRAIEDLVRILFEHRLELTGRIALSAQISEPDRSKGFNVPLHEGARWYYDRDKPTFLQENAEILALFVTLTVISFSALSAIRKLFDARRKNRADSFNHLLVEISQKARASTNLNDLYELRDRHAQILEDVVHALDTDDVTEDGFQNFSVTWESVGMILRDQINHISRETSATDGAS